MKLSRSFPLLCSLVLGVSAVAFAANEAQARQCTRLAFSVNDYGKEGPIRDAKKALDQYAKRWTQERGIKSYRMGEKTVNCELFLDFGFFDEHTCKAEASVCWGGGTTAAASAMLQSAASRSTSRAQKPASGPAVKPR